MNNDQEYPTERLSAPRTAELCALFSTTVSSLAADAAALRQLKSVAAGISEENENPNEPKELKDGLCHVESLVTELEGKVRMLQEIMAEEKRSLKEMESIKVVAEAQYQVLKQMLDTCGNAVSRADEEEAAASQPETRPAARTEHDEVHRSGARQGPRRDSIDLRPKHHHAAPPIRLGRITESEWYSVSRTIRGRITLAVVNDALLDIERVFRKKYEVLSRHKSSFGAGRHLELHQKLLNTHRELQVEEHGDEAWVSEQDLRQCCAFFRNGESTARAILLILRSVRRLKQVPGKNSQVTYMCMSSCD